MAGIHRPYPGLRPFGHDEADRFFGREDQVDQLLDKLAETHFLSGRARYLRLRQVLPGARWSAAGPGQRRADRPRVRYSTGAQR